MSFEQQLSIGQQAEKYIHAWFRSRGWSVLPVYDIPLDTGKGPRFYTAYTSGLGEIIAPDMLVTKENTFHWVEAKRKSRFTWRRYGKDAHHWQTGIDLRHYEHYLKLRDFTGIPLWIFFLHANPYPSADDLTSGSPKICPTGLFGGEICLLRRLEAHRGTYQGQGKSYPMVYWNQESLLRIAAIEDVLMAIQETGNCASTYRQQTQHKPRLEEVFL